MSDGNVAIKAKGKTCEDSSKYKFLELVDKCSDYMLRKRLRCIL